MELIKWQNCTIFNKYLMDSYLYTANMIMFYEDVIPAFGVSDYELYYSKINYPILEKLKLNIKK